MFQFLIGTLKTTQNIARRSSKQRFQFLIGTLKTHSVVAVSRERSVVSIPHRYAENSRFHGYCLRLDGVFQFLIGTLKTDWTELAVGIGVLFQFLIGTLKTNIFPNRTVWSEAFQFLIGTLKTRPPDPGYHPAGSFNSS